MKSIVCAMAIIASLGACSSAKKVEEIPPSKASDSSPMSPMINQKLTTSFVRQGIKLEWGCSKKSLIMRDCTETDLKSIEVTAYAPSFGTSDNARERAFEVAEMNAKAKLRHFMHEDVSSNRVVNTLTRSVEKSNDVLLAKVDPGNPEAVEFSDEEGERTKSNPSIATRQSINRSVRILTETVRTNAQGILRGVYVTDGKIVDRQTVAITIRWDKDSDRAAGIMRRTFTLQ